MGVLGAIEPSPGLTTRLSPTHLAMGRRVDTTQMGQAGSQVAMAVARLLPAAGTVGVAISKRP